MAVCSRRGVHASKVRLAVKALYDQILKHQPGGKASQGLIIGAFRSEQRLPALTWSGMAGSSIWRCSQPKVGLQGNRSSADEQYLKSMYGEEKAQQLSMGFEAYQADKFEEAAHILSQLNIEKDSLYFYRGNAYLQIKETDKAIQDFNKIMDDKSSQLKQQTEWYLLRAYLQNNKTAQAKKLQQIIINEPNHPFKVEASKLQIE